MDQLQPMAMTVGQEFELERMRRTIEGTTDVLELQKLAKMLLRAWQGQRAATSWAMRQGLQRPWAEARGAAQEVLAAQQKGAPSEAPGDPVVER
jgi:hypothetical protein